MKLLNKVAIVTGAASGIGFAIALRFAKEGAKVVIADLNQDASTAAVTEIQNQGGHAISVCVDVSDEYQVKAAIEKTLQTFQHIDILVSNAGFQHIESLDKISFEHWKKMLSVHLDGAFLMTRECLKAMYTSHRGGSIIYMGSVHSKEASLLKAPYVTAKHGLMGLCKVVAKEGAPYGVRANVICPGFVRTPLVEKQIPEQAKTLGISEEEVIKKIFLGQTVDGEFTTLDDIAELALFFATFHSNALSGQSINATHGWIME